MAIFVEYPVPVLVEVELETGVIASVRVDDESASGPSRVIDSELGRLGRAVERRAIALAEAESWPAWILGV